MLTRRLLHPSALRLLKPQTLLLQCSSRRAFHWGLTRPSSGSPNILQSIGSKKCVRRARLADWRLGGVQMRSYADSAQERIEEEGIPLSVRTPFLKNSTMQAFLTRRTQNSAPTTAALLAYAQTHWPAPSVVPAGWSTDWSQWDYLLTLFAFSPYFLRLPQIEMLVNIKYAIPGEVRPIMYSVARESLVFCVEMPDDFEDSDSDSEPESEVGEDGAAHVFLLDCRTFDLYTYDPAPPPAADGTPTYAQHAPDTIEELVLLIGAAPTPAAVPMLRLEPDEAGAAVLQRVLDRDASVIPVLEEDYLGYAPRATSRAEELLDANTAQRQETEALRRAIAAARATVRETEAELAREEAEVRRVRVGARARREARAEGVRAPRAVTGTLGLSGALRELTEVRVDGLQELVRRASEGNGDEGEEGEEFGEMEPSVEDVLREDAAHAEMRAALEDAKAKLAAMERELSGLAES
ncbi:hypothetical protein C8R46DRAFT_1271718 [Mycena filopes]|nr:hypothetical protein C8R46DRAFT_1271718 [Mycena filopes]